VTLFLERRKRRRGKNQQGRQSLQKAHHGYQQ
jgi:hypothetical protein